MRYLRPNAPAHLAVPLRHIRGDVLSVICGERWHEIRVWTQARESAGQLHLVRRRHGGMRSEHLGSRSRCRRPPQDLCDY